jgi:hypothetical protein
MGRSYLSYGIWDLPCWVIAGFIALVCLTGCLSYLVYTQGKTIHELNMKVIRYEGCLDVMKTVKEVESWNKRIYDDEYWWEKELERDMDMR